jgi:hypothetical protein
VVQKIASVRGMVYRKGMRMAGMFRMATTLSMVHIFTWFLPAVLLTALEVENLVMADSLNAGVQRKG